MKHINNFSKVLLHAVRVVIFCSFFLLLSNVSEATHYRYGSMSWEKVSGNTYRITVSQAWRKSFFPNVVGGEIVNTGVLDLGDGSSTDVLLKVTSIYLADDWFYGQFIYLKTYEVEPAIANYNLTFTGCCRINSLINAPEGGYLSSTRINVGTTNNSPIATFNPIKTAQINTINTFSVALNDPDGDALTYRFATAAEMGAANYVLPEGTSINAATGLVTFNGAGKALNEKYALGVVISDGETTVMVDFIVNMVAQSTPPQFDYSVTPVSAKVFQIAPGQNLSFGVKASDTDSGSTVFLTAVGLPIGSTFPLVAASNPVETAFSWTPTATQFGTYVVNFTATDNANVQTPTFITIVVSLKPVFDVPPTPAYGIELATQPGTPFQFTVQASDPDLLDVVRLTDVLNKPVNAVLTPLPSVATNPTTGNFTWNPAVSDWGTREIQFEATDSYGDKAYHKIGLIVNTPPVFTSTPTTSVVVNQPYSYLITGLDVDIPFGDILAIMENGVPSWVTFVDNGDGTGTLSGTPSIADAGNHTMALYLEDIYHHASANGVPSQIFTITVIPCTIALNSKTVTNVTCSGFANGTAQVLFTGGFGPFTYNWSNGTTIGTLTNAAPGTYNVSITDAFNCSIYDTVVITEPTPLTLTSSHSDFNGFGVSCKGGSNGVASVVAAGGVSSYNFVWSSGSTANAITGLAAGNYIVTATDANACSISNTVVLTEPTPLLVTSSHSDFNGFGVSCKGGSNGAASVVAAGGVSSYNFVWSTGSTANAVTGLAAGNYLVKITDANACASLATIAITEPTIVFNTITNLSNYEGFNVSCFAGTNGSATSAVIGGIAPYTYLWSNGITTKIVSGLSATTYSVVSTDKNGCSSTASVLLTAPTVLTASITSPTVIGSYNTSCSLDGDGIATVVGTGGLLPYTRIWNTGATTTSIAGLLAGSYSCILTDKNGCANASSISLTRPENCNCVTTPVAPTVSCASCTKVLDGMANAVINAGENACILNSFTGNINMNGGNLVICGNANLQSLNIPNNSKVTILGTITLNGINFSGANAILENYGTLVINYGLNVAGKLTNNKTITVKQGANFNAGSYVVNNGTINVASDLNNNGYFVNNGLLIVGNIMYNNSNSTMLNNCTTKAKAYFVNSNVVFANNGTLDVSNDTRFNSAVCTIASGSILRTKDVYLNGTTLIGATTSCALITASNYSQVNQASLNGKIALCDANGFEIKNNLTLLSGANTSCTTCGYTGVSVISNLRDAEEEDLTSVQIENGLTMYPNPVSNGIDVTISSSIEIVKANVFDNMGRIVLTTSSPVFNVTNLSAGIYLVKVEDVLGNLTITKLVVR